MKSIFSGTAFVAMILSLFGLLHFHSYGEVLGEAIETESPSDQGKTLALYLLATGVEDTSEDAPDPCAASKEKQQSVPECIVTTTSPEKAWEPRPIYPSWVEKGLTAAPPKVAPLRTAIPPGIRSGYPKVYAKDASGRLVCKNKNDKPGKSKQGKKLHMDMECCLDPDEVPNPHCYYPSEKYGKYLKKSHK